MGNQNYIDKAKAVESFYDLCRRKGLTPTPQREAVYAELASSREHPDAGSVYRAVRRRMPAVSLDTVYRALRSFERRGMVAAVTNVNDAVRYDADVESHSHFVCQQCGRVTDVAALEPAAMFDGVGAYGEVQSVRLEFRGICNNCRNKRTA